MWISRVIHLLSTSFIIFTIDSKAIEVSGTNSIEITSPVIICVIKINPIINPRFHKVLMEVGVGRSIKEVFTILAIG